MFQRPHPKRISNKSSSNQELEHIIQELQNSLSSEVGINRTNEKTIIQLERELQVRSNKIKSLHDEIERLENASEDEKSEMKAEILSLNKEIYKAKKDIRDKESYIGDIENKLEEYDETISFLKQRIKNITSRGNSPVPYNMANIDPFVNIGNGLH